MTPTNYHPEYVPSISPMASPMRYIEEYLKEHFFATELYTTSMMADEKKNPNDCVQYVYNKAFEIACQAKQRMANGKGEYAASCGSDHYLVLWAKYYYENDVEVKPIPKNVAAVSASPTAPSKPTATKPATAKKPTKSEIKADAQKKAKEDVDKAKADATKIAEDARKAKSGWIAEDYQHEEGECDNEDKPQAPIYDIKLPPKGNAPKVSSQFKRGTKEYKDALRKQSEEQDLFGDLFNEE